MTGDYIFWGAWLLGLLVTYRLFYTKMASAGYKERLECGECNQWLKPANVKGARTNCKNHDDVVTPGEIAFCIAGAIIWPVIAGIWVLVKAARLVIFFPTGRVKSKEKTEWDQKVRTVKTQRDYEAAQRAYQEAIAEPKVEPDRRDAGEVARAIEAKMTARRSPTGTRHTTAAELERQLEELERIVGMKAERSRSRYGSERKYR